MTRMARAGAIEAAMAALRAHGADAKVQNWAQKLADRLRYAPACS